MNAEPYQSLWAVNQSFQGVLEHLEKLKAAGVLAEATVRICQFKLEEMLSEINLSATIRLHTREANSDFLRKRRSELEVAIREARAQAQDGIAKAPAASGIAEPQTSTAPVMQDPATAPKEAS
jgi:DNA-binding Lrp family transcriptional regulator